MGKTSCEHLLHGRIVIGTLDCLYLEFPVIAAFGLAVLVHHHGSHGFNTAGIGYIICLHPADAANANQFPNLVHGSDGAQFFFLYALLVLGQDQGSVPGSQFHQAFLLPFFRHHDTHLLAPLRGQPLADDILVRQWMLEPQFPGDKRRARIKLLHKAVQDFAFILSRCSRHMEMVPADQLAFADEEHLYHRILLIPCHGHNVPVLHAAAGNLLLLGHLLHAV